MECCRELRDSRQRKNSEENTNCIALPRELELSEQKTIVEEQYEVFAEQKASWLEFDRRRCAPICFFYPPIAADQRTKVSGKNRPIQSGANGVSDSEMHKWASSNSARRCARVFRGCEKLLSAHRKRIEISTRGDFCKCAFSILGRRLIIFHTIAPYRIPLTRTTARRQVTTTPTFTLDLQSGTTSCAAWRSLTTSAIIK